MASTPSQPSSATAAESGGFAQLLLSIPRAIVAAFCRLFGIKRSGRGPIGKRGNGSDNPNIYPMF